MKLKSFLNAALCFVLTLVLTSFALTTFAHATGEIPAPLSTDEFLGALLASLGGLKGASTMGIVVIAVQLLMKLAMTKAGDLAGKWKLTIVFLLTLVSGVLGLVYKDHLSIAAALLHSTTLAALQVLAFQVIKQFSEDPSKPAPLLPPAA
jgi:hypothetical protein